MRVWLSIRLPLPPGLHLCVWTASPSNRRLSVSPFAQRALPRVLARMKTSDFQSDVGLPASLLVVPPYPPIGRTALDLPSSRLCLDDVPRSRTPVGSRESWRLTLLIWPSLLLTRSAPTCSYITGLNPFTLAHCGPSPPCVRFADAVTDADATRGTWCLATASRAGICLRLTQPSLARRTNKRGKSFIGF